MKELTPEQEADYFKRVIERNNSMFHEQVAEMREIEKRIKLKKYGSYKYVFPQNLKGSDIVREFIKLIDSNKITSESDVDNYFKKITKSKAPKEPVKPKIKGLIKDIEEYIKQKMKE